MTIEQEDKMDNMIIDHTGKSIPVESGNHMNVLSRLYDCVNPYDSYEKAVRDSKTATITLTDCSTLIRSSSDVEVVKGIIHQFKRTLQKPSWYSINEHVSLLLLREIRKSMVNDYDVFEDMIISIVKDGEIPYRFTKDEIITAIKEKANYSNYHYIFEIFK